MKQAKKYEYEIVDKTDGFVEDVLPTRAMAREEKRAWKSDGVDVKIVQKTYELRSVKVVR